MSSDSSCSDRNDLFLQNGIYRCDVENCGQYIPYKSLEAHLKLKHVVSNDGESRIKSNSIISLHQLKNFTTIPQLHDEPSINNDSAFIDASTPKIQRTVNSNKQFWDFDELPKPERFPMHGLDEISTSYRRRSIPVAKDLFNNYPASETILRKTVSKFRSTDGGSSVWRKRRSKSLSRVQPEDHMLCPFCSNMMHKDHIEGHIQRRHKTNIDENNGISNSKGINGQPNSETRIQETVSNVNSLVEGSSVRRKRRSQSLSHVQPKDHVRCTHCFNIMHKDYIEDHIQRRHKTNIDEDNGISNSKEINGKPNCQNQVDERSVNVNVFINEDKKHFVRCKFCNALMHGNYIPKHIERKHNKEQIAGCGIIWSQHNDEQINEWLQKRCLYVKNGTLIFKEQPFHGLNL